MGSRTPYRYDDPAQRVIPSWTSAVGRAGARVVGGPWGRHARTGQQRFWTPMRVLFLLATISLTLAWLKQRSCAFNPWVDGMQYTHLCYSDTIPLRGIEGIADGAVPYFSMDPSLAPGDQNYYFGRVEYPVLTGFFMYFANALAAPADWVIDLVHGEVNGWAGYFAVTCLLLSLCYFAVVYFTARTAGRRVWDGAIVALAPIVVVHAFTNWDLFAMAFLAAALFAWSRERTVLAGVLIGLGTAAKLYPFLMLGALLVLAIRTMRWRGFLNTLAGAVGGWAVVNVPVMLGAWAGWRVFLDLNRERQSDYATLWQIVERTLSSAPQFEFGRGSYEADQLPASTINLWVFVAMALCCLGIAILTLAAPHRPRVAQLVFLIVAAFLLTNKVWSSQFSIWLLPLMALALPRWRIIIGWEVAETFVWICVMNWFVQRDIYFHNQGLEPGADTQLQSGVDYEWVALFVMLRSAFVIAMMVLVVRDILFPEHDRVRAVGQDDPSGGEFDHAPDRFVLPIGRRGAAPRPPGPPAPAHTAEADAPAA
ncbi:glycosyltransferase family 87 protein [Blastococcus sp. Marseille-P5729]|uniref:glycosyltransferase family 87 protein n=1 Tax=Blastococcus sp. Marseille-P5729 TaxID=2086582 RepID=UPI00131E52C7|nr:glycosyltransferase 87 family protein [Blastococcus sp. Marseille-P5729]